MKVLTLLHNHAIVYIVVLSSSSSSACGLHSPSSSIIHHPQCFLMLNNLTRIHSVVHHGWTVELPGLECSIVLRKDPSRTLHVVK